MKFEGQREPSKWAGKGGWMEGEGQTHSLKMLARWWEKWNSKDKRDTGHRHTLSCY